MRSDAIPLEAQRLDGLDAASYPWFHERHRVFPAVFEGRGHRRIIDLAAGMGVVGRRIRDGYDHDLLLCNDISPVCLRGLQEAGLATCSFDLDDDQSAFPFEDGSFDAVVALATIEHLLHIDHFVKEARRVLDKGGCLYLSAPNYSGLAYLLPLLATGRTFHDPLDERERYEFYAHVRYFTYRSLVEYVASFGLAPQAVYVPLPEGSARYRRLRARSRVMGGAMRLAARMLYRASARWASEPVICFARQGRPARLRKVLL